METKHYLQKIKEAFPDLKWAKYRRVQTMPNHPDHVMILLDNKIAFRFENDIHDEDTNLLRERTILSKLQNPLGNLPIPDYTYIPQSPYFAGYKLIQGTRLSPWRFERLSKSNRSEAAKRLGAFLTELHSFPITQARSFGVRERAEANDKSFHNRLRGKEIFVERSSELQPEIRKIFKNWIERSETIDHAFTPVLIHNDLWYKHIYHNPSTGKLTGIIDWGDIEITDPAKDFYGFWIYGEAFLDDVLSHYKYADTNLKNRSFEHFWGIAIMGWFSRPPGGRFFRKPTWSKRPFSEWPMSQIP